MQSKKQKVGIDRNLTSYGDREFSRYMRRAFLSSAGYDPDDLSGYCFAIMRQDEQHDKHSNNRELKQCVANYNLD